MNDNQRVAYQIVRHAYTSAQQREAETGAPFDITPGEIEAELARHSEKLDAIRLQKVVDAFPWAMERLRRRLIS
jgi:hypothetical protein